MQEPSVAIFFSSLYHISPFQIIFPIYLKNSFEFCLEYIRHGVTKKLILIEFCYITELLVTINNNHLLIENLFYNDLAFSILIRIQQIHQTFLDWN